MQIENVEENIPYLKTIEMVDVTEEDILRLREKGLKVEKLTVTRPANGLNNVTQYQITGRVHEDGTYIDFEDKAKVVNPNAFIERFVSIIVSPDTGRTYIERVSSSTGDPINNDSSKASKQIEEFCRKR